MKLYFASGNAHKAAELQQLADRSPGAHGRGWKIISAREVGGMPPVLEDTGTFVGNALKKARALKAKLPEQTWVVADDSGLCVDALDGGPGVESAYYAGPQGDGAANLRKLVDEMRDVRADQRRAHFICVLVVVGPADREWVFEGRCDGMLLAAPKGGAGFGYDPLFVPSGYAESFSELGDDVKGRISHRARAWEKLTRDWLT